MATIRPFQRSDRDQLTALVNAHIAAVVPGVSVSVNALMSQLEREPGEGLVDPWVAERQTLVAVEREMVIGGAHLLRYADEDRVGPDYRGFAEVRWLVCRHDGDGGLLAACLDVLRAWEPRRLGADGALPAPFVYGVPSVWPHVRALYAGAGFAPTRVERLLVAEVADLPAPESLGLEVVRSHGEWTRLSALRDGAAVGYIELEMDFTVGGTLSRFSGWADVGNLVGEGEVQAWLLGQARDWLRLGRIDRLVAYADEDEDTTLLERAGFRELVRTERGWVRDP